MNHLLRLAAAARNDDLVVVLLIWLVGLLVNGIGAIAFLEFAETIGVPEARPSPLMSVSGQN